MNKKINIYVSDCHQENLQFFAHFYRLTGRFKYITFDAHLDAWRMYLTIEDDMDFEKRKEMLKKNLENVKNGRLVNLKHIGNKEIYNSIFQLGFCTDFYIVNKCEEDYYDVNTIWDNILYEKREKMNHHVVLVGTDGVTLEKAIIDSLLYYEDSDCDIVLDIDLDIFDNLSEMDNSMFFFDLLIRKCKYITITKSNEVDPEGYELFHSETFSSEGKYIRFLSLLEEKGYLPKEVKIDDIY